MNHFSTEPKNKLSGNVLIGAFIIVIGMLLLIDNTIYDLPRWIFRWHTLLIALGLLIGAKNNWKDKSWLVLVVIGGAFTAVNVLPHINLGSIVFPVILLGIGLYMILKSNKKSKNKFSSFPPNTDPDPFKPTGTDGNVNTESGAAPLGGDFNTDGGTSPLGGDFNADSTKSADSDSYTNYAGVDDYLESVNVFGGSQQVVYSKNFKGGEIVSVFGGCDVNFSQADFNGVVKLEVVAVFGGAKIIVPSGWVVKSEVTAILGGVTDKRPIQSVQDGNRKLLIITGVAMFGGVDIRNY